MAKTLDFAYQSPQEVKVGDDETTFTLICKNEDKAVDLTGSESIIAKIGNQSGYLREQPINLDSSSDMRAGQINLTFEKSTLDNFPPDLYNLEIWVTNSNGTSIYPSGNPLSFTVTANIENSSGANITTVAYDDFVKAMNKAASTIAKGDKGEKGDTGTVDNAGLTTAPAFVNLQTQVDNSAVGTNLLLGTSGTLQTVTNASGWNTNLPILYPVITTIDNDTTYTARAWLSSVSHDISVQIVFQDSSGVTRYGSGNSISAGTSGYSTWTGTITAGATIQRITICFIAQQSTDSAVSYKEIKLEKGSVATDWCPNPAEVLTQSDYAKIQAAIVALGGSLK